jgi:hypothetical protein
MLSGILNRPNLKLNQKALKSKEVQISGITSFGENQIDNRMSSQISTANFRASQNLQNKAISFTGWEPGPYGSRRWVETEMPTQKYYGDPTVVKYLDEINERSHGPFISDFAEDLAKNGNYLDAAREKLSNAAKHREYGQENNAHSCEKTAHEYLEKAVEKGQYKEAAGILEQIAKTHENLGNSEAAYLLRCTAEKWLKGVFR